MSRFPLTEAGGQPEPAEQDPTLLDFAAVLLRQWKPLVITGVVVAALTAAYALTRPTVYTTRLVLVPSATPDMNSRAQLLASQLPGLLRLAGGSGANPSQALVQAILRSEALRDSVVRVVAATPEGREVGARQLRRAMRKKMEVNTDPADRSVEVLLTTTSARAAARLAQEIPGAVNRIAGGLAMEANEVRREALEQQRERARRRLEASEERVREFEQRHGTPVLQEQARRTIEAASELQAQIAAAELRVARLRRTSTEENPLLQAALSELQGLRGQMARLQRGGGASDLMVPTGQVPEIKMELTRLTRQYMADEQVYLGLTAEALGIENNPTDLTVVSVLDAPVVPDEPSGPRVKLFLALGVMLGAVLGLFAAFAADYLARARHSADHQAFFMEWDRLRGRKPASVRAANGTRD